ncbi:acyl-CoA-binding domain-containing protein 5-like isoform X2 [Mya arenaria]|uniref:acyl-CoA-binding domain-containing protein 5-like isoform X2 n=1 Tax=Mya arenaria TaxID=6604 RepID=UPI0022E8A301|nr:acyl-CoA-binding domain-containing protein 5-like isoform X2 [Mya arenaria]
MAAASPKEKFDSAVKVIHSLPKDGPFQPSREMMLTFYGYYKQATEGPCKLPKPSFWDVVKKAKWDAWNKLGDMKREHAMDKYVEELKKIVEAMPQTQVVGDFMDKLGAFYEVVDEESPIEQARTARSAKSLPPDHNYNLQPIDHLQNSALAEFDTRDDDLNDPGAGEGDSGVSLTQNGHSPTPPRDISSSDSEEEFCDTSTDLEFPLERREVLHNGPVPSTISTHVKTSRVRFADVNDNHSSSSNGHSHESFTVPQGFPYISPRPGTQDDSLIVQTSSPVTSRFKDLNGDLEVSPSDLDIGREVVIDRLSPVGPGVAPQGQREENEPPNGGNGDKGKDNERSKSGQGATPKRSGSQGLPSAGGSGRRLLLAGGGGGGGDQTGGEGSGDPVGEQISLTLARLQQDMAQVLDRLNRLEAQSRQGQGPDKTNGSIFSWFRPSGNAGRMAFFFLVWPVIVHLLLTYIARRRRRR